MSDQRRWTAPVLLAAAGYVLFTLCVPIFCVARVQDELAPVVAWLQWPFLRTIGTALVSLLITVVIATLGWIGWRTVCIRLLSPADYAAFMKELGNFHRDLDS
jgi:hypothetical protein